MNIKPSFDRETGKRIGEAVVIAGLCAVASKLGEWAVESIRATLNPPPRAEESTDAGPGQ